jgi:GNAT superfamily N-acetyltransferase
MSTDQDLRVEAIPLSTSDLPEVLQLIASSYGAALRADPVLPPVMMGSTGAVEAFIGRLPPEGAVGLVGDGGLLGFMCVSSFFPFKGVRAALVAVPCHAAASHDRATLYRLLYEKVGEYLQRHGARLHIVAHFAHDRLLQQTLHELGFGALLAERVRALSPVEAPAAIEIAMEDDVAAVADLEVEHMRYYRRPPIYLWKDDSAAAVQERLLLHKERGHRLFVHREGGRPDAFFFVGRCTGDEEGLTLRDTGTAQIMEAYTAPAARGKGIGKALLNSSIKWAREQGYSRLFVEHETANTLGSAFWARHFNPYVSFTMRYVEDTSAPPSRAGRRGSAV